MDIKSSIIKCIIITIIWFCIFYGISFIPKSLPLIKHATPFIVYIGLLVFLKYGEKIKLFPNKKIKRSLFYQLLIIVLCLAICLSIFRDPFINFSFILKHKNLNIENIQSPYPFDIILILHVLGQNLEFLSEFLIATFIAPFIEEIVFRGYFFRGLLNKYNAKIAFLVSSMLFALVHLPSITNIIFIFIIGLVYAYLFYQTSNLWLSVVLHSVFNLLTYVKFIMMSEYMYFIAYIKFGYLYWAVIFLTAAFLVALLYLISVIASRRLA